MGKTLIGIVAMRRFVNANPNGKCILVVPSQPVLSQWKKEIMTCGLSGNVYIYTKDYASKNSSKLSCDMLVIDEVHEIFTPSKISIFSISYKLILCMTATLERLDGRDTFINKVAPVCDVITLAEGIKNKWTSEHRVIKVLIDIDLTKYNELTKRFKNLMLYFNYNFDAPIKIISNEEYRKLYIEMELEERYGHICNYEERKSYYRELMGEIMNNAREFMKVMGERKEFIYHHERKIEIARMIIDSKKDLKGITFWNSIEDAVKVDRGVVYVSKSKDIGMTPKQQRIILSEFKKSKTGVINTVKALNTGFNCPDISYGIVGGFDSSKTRRKQSCGRVIRIDRYNINKNADIFYLILRGTKDEDWAELSLKGVDTVTILESDLKDYLGGKDVMFVPTRHKNNATRY